MKRIAPSKRTGFVRCVRQVIAATILILLAVVAANAKASATLPYCWRSWRHLDRYLIWNVGTRVILKNTNA